jgi:hypothetical protein
MAYKTITSSGESWQPNPGDDLEGEVIATGTGESQYGEFPWVTVRKKDDTEVLVNGFGTILQRTLPKLNVGDQVCILYGGMQKAGNSGREYKAYEVLVDQPVDGDVAVDAE